MKKLAFYLFSVACGVVATGFGLWVISLAGHFKGF
ncbi:hypothetical protein [Klebsiella phage vB_KpnS-VAC6]|uniref:Uncharacterized protein n=1 Tax=Klebsiella phage vB_KpnS-VAC6 TaxID=2864364 RepID=A0AAE7XHV8_9CAUD|nr:hypothetical protein [Klebsiella phage vB_KpnS-VAC6]CAK6589205.1 hypothetical protein K31PH164_LOCUS33 [Klebsiella phage vB_Kpn_K31PH164]CAK6597088.1 hypothetical protein K33PH14C2_LOCUS34 [Klebsiella phage vB_Kpn_K33PH14C2]